MRFAYVFVQPEIHEHERTCLVIFSRCPYRLPSACLSQRYIRLWIWDLGYGIFFTIYMYMCTSVYIRLPACQPARNRKLFSRLLIVAVVAAVATRAEIINISVICCTHRCIYIPYIYMNIYMFQTAPNFFNVYYNK